MIKELITTYRYPFGCILISIASFVVFYILGRSGNADLFERGGSIIVLFGAASEYGLSKIYSEKINQRVNGLGGLSGPVIKDLNVGSLFQFLRAIAHICVTVGTFIWGFGDYFF